MQDIQAAIAENLPRPAMLGDILSGLMNDGRLADHVDVMVEQMADGSPRHIDLTNGMSMILIEDPRFRLFLRRYGGRRSRVQARDQHLVAPARPGIGVFGDGARLEVDEYEVVEEGSRLKRSRTFTYDRHVLIEKPGDGIVRDYVSDEAVWMLKLNMGEIRPEVAYFDRATLERSFSGVVRGVHTSLVTLCQLFGSSGDRGALPYLEQLTRNDAFFVRWAAIQAMGRLDRDRALLALNVAVDDAHLAVRSAARKTLASIEVGHGR